MKKHVIDQFEMDDKDESISSYICIKGSLETTNCQLTIEQVAHLVYSLQIIQPFKMINDDANFKAGLEIRLNCAKNRKLRTMYYLDFCHM